MRGSRKPQIFHHCRQIKRGDSPPSQIHRLEDRKEETGVERLEVEAEERMGRGSFFGGKEELFGVHGALGHAGGPGSE